MTYNIVIYRRGKTITTRYKTLESAKAAAHDIFKQTGLVIGIEAEE